MFHIEISGQKVYLQLDANIRCLTNFLLVTLNLLTKQDNLKRKNTLEFVQELYTINPWKSTLLSCMLTHNTFAKSTLRVKSCKLIVLGVATSKYKKVQEYLKLEVDET